MQTSLPTRTLSLLAAMIILTIIATPTQAEVVFSASFETPVVSGFASNTVPATAWIGATLGFGATNRGLYNGTVAWPATPPFTTRYGAQAYYLNYTNSGLTTSQGATGKVLTAGVTYTVTFNTAVVAGSASSTYLVQLVAFAPADDNAARANCQSPPGTVLGTASGAVTTTDMAARASIVFTPAAGNANLGKELGIRLLKSTGSVLYDNIRLVVGHDLAPSPEDGVTIAGGNVALSWVNMPPNVGSNTYVDVWFGTNSAALTKVVSGGLNTTTATVSAPVANTYYLRVDSYLDGTATGTPVTGNVFSFVITDTDGDGFPDSYELAHTTPASNTALNPGDDLDADGLTNLQEYQYGTNPNNPDTDGDTLKDGAEIAGAGLRPPTSPLLADTDRDGLSDAVETNTGIWAGATNTGTNPTDADWDKDGLKDGAETKTGVLVDRNNTGTNPYLADTDGDGAGDWYEVTATFTNPNSNTSKPSIPYPLPDPDSSTGVTTKPVKVYIMSGQSNMVGIGYVTGTAPGSLETIAKRENKFPNLVNGSGAWTTRNDVKYRGVVTAIGDGLLTVGQGSSSTTLGPELGFGQVMGWYHGEPVLLLKASQGNRSLGWDFQSPGSARITSGGYTYAGYGETPDKWLTGTTPTPVNWYAGYQYDQCFLARADMAPLPAGVSPIPAGDNVTYVLDNFATQYPAWAAQGFEIAGYVWWQGNKDIATGSPYTDRYETNMVQLIKQLRAYYANRYPGKCSTTTPFVLATGCGDPGTSGNGLVVANAQLAASDPVKHPEFAGNVKTMDTRGYWRSLAESPGTQGFHYNNNAETYMLTGDALGRGMIEMLSSGTNTDYATWSGLYSGANLSAPNADLDGDGFTNDFERSFGLDPTKGSSVNPVTFSPTLAAGTFTYTRRNPALSGLTYTVWTSPDLVTWTQDTNAVQTPGTPNANGVQSVTVTVSPARLGGARLFMRMRAQP